MGNISELDMYLFGQGTHYDIYQKLGAHIIRENGITGVRFAVWAPHGVRVSVIGTFNDWKEDAHVMERLEPMGIYELFIPGVQKGDLYKFCIDTEDGRRLMKADPYAFWNELRPGTASRVADTDKFVWSDGQWMRKRQSAVIQEQPMSIYEVHPGSWMRHPGRTDVGYYTYRELAHSLVDYVKEMGYTHVELMGILEHPFDGSWGYQVTGYYAPTSRFGPPEDFMYLVNYLHKHRIGVILDWVPAHFPKDIYGLTEFDGTPLYEYADPRLGEHADWGTKIFDYSKNEVKNFLIGSALMWVEKYHIDGLRVDAVASMLYLDFGKKEGMGITNRYGDNRNLEAVEFFKHLNTLIRGRNPGVAMIAEESTTWPMITGEAKDGGLSFDFKWNMGWMHDFLDYMKLDPIYRKFHHHKMTFAMSYNSSENYMLVLSHDEVVHLKCSMLNKMPGLGRDKYDNLKVAYAFMMGHPGKKLLFMGQDIAQIREWSEERELDWFLLAQEEHRQVQETMKELLHIYQKYPCMYQDDNNLNGFEWINADDMENSIYTFVRKSRTGRKNLLFVCNFTPMERKTFRVGVPAKRQYRLIFNSDEKRFGGNGKERQTVYKAEAIPWDGREHSIGYELPAYGIAIFTY